MMTPEEMGKSICNTHPFAWMPGMLTVGDHHRPVRLSDDRESWPLDLHVRYPDLKDPPTKGCLISLLKVATGQDGLYVSIETTEGNTWGVFEVNDAIVTHRHPNEEEAIVAAFITLSEDMKNVVRNSPNVNWSAANRLFDLKQSTKLQIKELEEEKKQDRFFQQRESDIGMRISWGGEAQISSDDASYLLDRIRELMEYNISLEHKVEQLNHEVMDALNLSQRNREAAETAHMASIPDSLVINGTLYQRFRQ